VSVLSPHPNAALEYWFFKVNWGHEQANDLGLPRGSEGALLVDWIARRKRNEHVLRVSIHSLEQRAVLFSELPLSELPITNEENSISTKHTTGESGTIAWDLRIECGNERIVPDIFPSRLLRMTDLTLVSAPLAAFTGWVHHGSTQVELERTPGLLSHYWGRQLAHKWLWISASQFDREGAAVECAVFRSALWGLPLQMPLAYLYLRYDDSRQLLISPPAVARVSGSPERFDVHIRRFGAEPIFLKGHGREYGDFGDGIINTLVGDLEVWKGKGLVGRAERTAALEWRS
jgi:hypothetical protein